MIILVSPGMYQNSSVQENCRNKVLKEEEGGSGGSGGGDAESEGEGEGEEEEEEHVFWRRG